MAKLYVWNIKAGHQGYNGWENRPNSVGGCSVRWDFKNNTDKTIKYAAFVFTPYNRVSDREYCRIRKVSTDGVRCTGPIKPGEIVRNSFWENAWYNSGISRVSLMHVIVDYMDGSTERIELSDISLTKPEGAGCYVATAVYGSYDCPQVWTLRRFRDNTLAETWYGRAFIRTYYAISPTLVKWFGETDWFRNMWRGRLDRMVQKLQDAGVEATPYEDKIW